MRMKKLTVFGITILLLFSVFTGCDKPEIAELITEESESSTEGQQGAVVNPGGETAPEGETKSGNEANEPSAAEPAREEDRAADGSLDLTPEEAVLLDPDVGISSVRETKETEKETNPGTKKNAYQFDSVEQAENSMDLGLREFRAYKKADTGYDFTNEIEARYKNRYLIPYLEVLAKNQITVDPDSVDSDWFTEPNDSLVSKLQGSYGNIYRKMAQDMLPYMLPDPDDIVSEFAGAFGGSASASDKLDYAAAKAAYEEWNSPEMRRFRRGQLLSSDLGTYWEDYIYGGSGYSFGSGNESVYLGFTCPNYNRRYFINLQVFGEDDDENRTSIQPTITANNLLSEIQYVRERSPQEQDIQFIDVSIRAGSEARCLEIAFRALRILQPYASYSELSERFHKMQQHWYYNVSGYNEPFRFDFYLDYWEKNNYSFQLLSPDPLYDRVQEKFPGAGYMTNIQDSYFNHTGEANITYSLINNGKDDNGYHYYFRITLNGPTAVFTDLYRDDMVYYSNYKPQMGIFYPFLTTFYYNEAAKAGLFTPYVIPDEATEGKIDLIPQYEMPETFTTYGDYTAAQQSLPSKETTWLTDGFGADQHEFPPGTPEREPMDLSKLGYKKNVNGDWVRTMVTRGVYETSRELIYDETGLLKEGRVTYDDGSNKMITYKTRADGSPSYSREQYYDKNGDMTMHSITKYSDNGRTQTYYETELRHGETDYLKTEELTWNNRNEITGVRRYYEDQTVRFQYTSSEYEAMSGSYGDVRHEKVRQETYTSYNPDGSIASSESEQTVLDPDEKEDAKHAVQRFLEEKTGIKRR